MRLALLLPVLFSVAAPAYARSARGGGGQDGAKPRGKGL